MKYLSFIATTLILGISNLAFTQIDLEQKAKEILDKVSKTYKAQKALYTEFNIVTENKAEKMEPVTEAGKIWIKGDKYKLELDEQVIICNGKTIWTYLKKTKELTIETYNSKDVEISPATIFSFYQKGFQSKFDGTYTKDNIKYDKVALNPNDKKKPYFYIILHVKESDSNIKQVDISYKSGIRQTINITSQTSNQTLDTKFFEYDPIAYPATTTDDLR
ncbi:MAG: outer membrane lipoprotein carrier protein LolA [Bacteroidia bacterium]|jgi:outer membrane lipoprotein-sorting protein|nr:outer membrane lipoprotein carrier protein LolA [Bacteroidia bacterium]MCO5254665.1 outer membrane lipoprotein carrier protein LolA [Bacteroidota bacterium]MCZ2129435.1 outer membrane lipoprotein carrier protein LolA [Bacteroidia bacterium]